MWVMKIRSKEKHRPSLERRNHLVPSDFEAGLLRVGMLEADRWVRDQKCWQGYGCNGRTGHAAWARARKDSKELIAWGRGGPKGWEEGEEI